jgi:hypothetical protein
VRFFPPYSSNQLQPLDLSLFGITKRLLRRLNRLDFLNIQTKHIARIVPVNIVRIFAMSGIYPVKVGDQILCTVRPGQAKRLLILLPPCFPEIGGRDDGEDSDAEEQQAYLEECAGLLYDLNLPDDQETLQTR